MDKQNDNKQFINDEGESNDNRKELCGSNDDNFVFVPAENIRAIEKVIRNWEAVKTLWMKMSPASPHDDELLTDC
jgi:hypothetical protein